MDFDETVSELHGLLGRVVQVFALAPDGTHVMTLMGTLAGAQSGPLENGYLFEVENGLGGGFYLMKSHFVSADWEAEVGGLKIVFKQAVVTVRVAIPPDVIARAQRAASDDE